MHSTGNRGVLMATLHYITQVNFDFGAAKTLSAECERLGIKRPLIVTDRGVVAAGVIAHVLEHLRGVVHALYDGTPSNPTENRGRRSGDGLSRA